jgi:hypothetical protein
LKRALDVKSKLFHLSRLATLGQPFLRRAWSFYPELRLPDSDRVRLVHRSAWRHPWRGADYAEQRAFVLHDNVDSTTASDWSDPDATERFVAIVSNAIVPGHRVTPVDPTTGAQISSDGSGLTTWNRARPSISALTSRQLSSDLTIVIPRMTHFGHLLTDVLMPQFFALQLLGFSEGRRLNVVTSEQPVGLILAFIGALRHAGYEITHVTAPLWNTIHAPRLLYASTHSRNLELKFATPEALGFMREHLLAALPVPAQPLPRRIFLLRGDTRTRRVDGEMELAKKLEEIGFVAMVGRWSNLNEQIAGFRDAEAIVAAHGAGLANILWSGPRALLIEICADNARKTTGLHWASSVGANYYALTGSDEGALQNFSVDPDAAFVKIRALVDAHTAA